MFWQGFKKNQKQTNKEDQVLQPTETRNAYYESILKMALEFKIKFIPLKEKIPILKDWQKKASNDPEMLKIWIRKYPGCYFGMPCDEHFALDKDGPDMGDIDPLWLNDNPYQQKTKKGKHWLFKQPKKKIRNKQKFSGDFDIRGAGGQIRIYHPIFNEFCLPQDVPEAPQELLDLITAEDTGKKEDRKFGRGKNNKAVAQHAGRAGASGSITQLSRSVINLVKNNPGNPEVEKHVTDLLNKSNEVFALYHQPKTMPLPPKDKTKTKTKKQKGDPGPEHPSQQASQPKTKKHPLEPEPVPEKIITPEVFIPKPLPRIWHMGYYIFVEGRLNQLTGPEGVGKSSFSREYAYRYWQQGGTIVMFAQEDNEDEDIAPFLISKKLPENKPIKRFYVYTDWGNTPPSLVLKALKHINKKLIILDPVHALFEDVTRTSECRKNLLEIRDELKNPSDTVILVNHPKADWQKRKLTPSEINASSKEIGRICRSSTFCSFDPKSNLNYVEHSKRQLSSPRYSFKLVEDHIQNNQGQRCSYSKIEEFKVITNDKASEDTKLLPGASVNLSAKREKLREEIISCLGAVKAADPSAYVEKDELRKHLKAKEWELSHELSEMIKEDILEAESRGKLRAYRTKITK